MVKKIIALVIIALFLSACSKKLPTQTNIENQIIPEPAQTQLVEIKASFAIFTSGTFRTFSAAMYHNQSEDAYLEASNPNVVIVKKTNTTWGDFFNTLPFTVTSDCLTTGTGQKFCSGSTGELKFYLNGQKVQNLLETEIGNGDKVLISFGNETEAQIQNQLSQIPQIE